MVTLWQEDSIYDDYNSPPSLLHTVYWTNINSNAFARVKSMWLNYWQMRVIAVIAAEENPNTYIMDYSMYTTGYYTTVTVNYVPNKIEFHTWGAFVYDDTLQYFAGTISRWPKPTESNPNWGFISTQNYVPVIDFREPQTISSSRDYPSVTRTQIWYSWGYILNYARRIYYQTYDA